MHETFEHTADLGLRIRASTLNELFAEAGEALFATLVEGPESVRPLQEVEFAIAGDEVEYLFFDWLNRLLGMFEVDHLLLCRFQVVVGEGGLTARVAGEPLDRDRHELGHEVKAVTYHGLKVEPTPGGWLAEVIVDI